MSDGLVAGFPLGVQPTLAFPTRSRVVYTGLLPHSPLAHADEGLARVADVGRLPRLSPAPALSAAVLVVTALAAIHVVPGICGMLHSGILLAI